MISLNWVADYIDISDQEPRELAKKVTEAGIAPLTQVIELL